LHTPRTRGSVGAPPRGGAHDRYGPLAEEGAPQFILTDRGKEFDNVLLRELMRLLKVRLHMTPSY